MNQLNSENDSHIARERIGFASIQRFAFEVRSQRPLPVGIVLKGNPLPVSEQSQR